MIDNNKSLRKLCYDIRNNSNGIVGIDTEFIRKFTYYPLLCIIQVVYFSKIENKNVKDIIDVLAPDLNLKPFFNILKDSKIKKIIHSCSQDIEALNFLNKIKIKNLDDTQIMAEFCGYKKNIGYTDAVNSILGIDFKKNKNTRISNWKKRPLAKRQLKYALNDVEYLIELYDKLLKQVKEYDNYEYYCSEMKYFLKFKEQKFVLKHLLNKVGFMVHKKSMNYVQLVEKLLIWREEKAITSNIIRHKILTDRSIGVIADTKPKDLKELKEIFKGRNDLINLKKVYKAEILAVINLFLTENKHKYANKIYYTNEVGFKQKSKLNCIYNKIGKFAIKRHINIHRLLSKRDIISLLMHYNGEKEILYGWKYDLLAGVIDDLL